MEVMDRSGGRRHGNDGHQDMDREEPMSRVLFRRAARGQRLVRGELVRRLQLGLRENGSDPGDIDGIFGGDTEGALRRWREDGDQKVVDEEDWRALVDQPPPTIFERALQLTADFEQHGFGRVAGNFDGAWLTWGIIGFTLKHGEMQRIINEVSHRHPALLEQAFGTRASELVEVVSGDSSAQEAFANRISIGRNRYKVQPEWADGFATLGEFDEVQAIQMQRVGAYWDIAERDARRFDLDSELGIAMAFDIAVQNGGIDFRTEQNSILRRLAQDPPQTATERRALIADVVAENSKQRYVEDVRSRKRTIAEGQDRVHGANYMLADWGIGEEPWATAGDAGS